MREFEHSADFDARDFDKPETDDDVWYDIQGYYGSGWETVTCEFGLEDAKRMLNDYDENEPSVPHRMRIAND